MKMLLKNISYSQSCKSIRFLPPTLVLEKMRTITQRCPFTSFLEADMIKISSLIETFYFLEDILFQQYLVIAQQVHHLRHGQAEFVLDLGQTQDVVSKFPDQGKVVS